MNTPTGFDQVHDSRCWDVRGLPVTTRAAARNANPDSWAHSCLNLGPAEQPVVVTRVNVDPHPYTPACVWPAGAPRAICRVCHSWAEHADEKSWELDTLNRRLAMIQRGEW